MFDATKNSNLNLLDELLIQENEKREILLSKIVPDEDSKDISITTALLKSIQQNIAHLNTIISKLEIQRNKETSNIRYNQTVLNRFHLLKQQYISDIERLQFIDEGSFLIDQLVVNKCPHCGKKIDSFHDKCDGLDYGMVSTSCEYEISQTELKLSELDKSISTTLSVISEGKSRLIKIENDIRINNKKLEDTLNPELDSLNKKMKEFSNIEKIKTELEQIDKKIIQYNTLISDFKEKKHLRYSSPNQTALDIIKNAEFDEELCKTLNSFYYPKDEKINIEFYMNKFKELDFAINEENRISFGKGSRALLASSFYIAVRNYCNKMNYPHSNFLILDSPINAFKDLKANEILDSSIKNKFIKYLSKELCNFQTIIMENLDISDIPNNIKNKIHIIEFTKSCKGRYGFF